eukprot:scaffold177538_cov16-Tisochrysis_lutea.AAC.1
MASSLRAHLGLRDVIKQLLEAADACIKSSMSQHIDMYYPFKWRLLAVNQKQRVRNRCRQVLQM